MMAVRPAEAASSPRRQVFARLADLPACIGQELGVGEWMEIDQARIDRFAEATGDRQWIHTDPARAEQGPFGTTVAHGFLTLSLLPRMLAEAFEVQGTRLLLNYGLDRVRFPAPVPAGSRLRGRVLLRAFEAIEGGAQLMLTVTVECEGSPRPACVAEAVVRCLI